jgi:hypothetical protein
VRKAFSSSTQSRQRRIQASTEGTRGDLLRVLRTDEQSSRRNLTPERLNEAYVHSKPTESEETWTGKRIRANSEHCWSRRDLRSGDERRDDVHRAMS